MDSTSKTHFGYQTVEIKEKQHKVNEIFTKVADKYDIMNDVMSFGIHHYWKWLTIYTSNIRKGSKVFKLLYFEYLSDCFRKFLAEQDFIFLADKKVEISLSLETMPQQSGFTHPSPSC